MGHYFCQLERQHWITVVGGYGLKASACVEMYEATQDTTTQIEVKRIVDTIIRVLFECDNWRFTFGQEPLIVRLVY